MAIDFSQVKSLTIPEGDVKSISIGGVVVWQKPQEQSWHTIWSGSKSVGVLSGTQSGDATNWQHTESNTGYTPRIRITFSTTTSGTASYVVNGTTTSTKPSSPYTMTLNVGTSTLTVLRAQGGSSTQLGYGQITANRDTTNNRVNFNLVSYKYPNNFTGAGQLTITKIEQYY